MRRRDQPRLVGDPYVWGSLLPHPALVDHAASCVEAHKRIGRPISFADSPGGPQKGCPMPSPVGPIFATSHMVAYPNPNRKSVLVHLSNWSVQ